MADLFADLHIHTSLSDGTFTPKEVVDCALKNSLAAIAITDHDTVEGIKLVMAAAKDFDLEVIPGVELTADVDGKEVHLLGLYIDWQTPWFQDKLRFLCQSRLKRAKEIIKRLEDLGVVISFESLKELASAGSMGRLHIAQALIKEGYVTTVVEAFQRYIGNGKPAYVPNLRLTPQEVIEMVLAVNGIPILAHPYLLKNDSLISSLVKLGLRGIEAYWSDQDPWSAKRYQEIAEGNGLLITGGSDCHGLAKGEALMGRVKVPYSLIDRLKEEKLRMEEGLSKGGEDRRI